MRLALSDKLDELYQKRRISKETFEDLMARYQNFYWMFGIIMFIGGLFFGLAI